MHVDCLILTALQRELEPVLAQFRGFKAISGSFNTTHPYFETIAPNGLRVVAGGMSGMGALAAASITQEAIRMFNPSAILLVGIAGGMDREISLGDVVASEQIVDYELGKIADDGFTPRWSVYRSDAKLLAKARAWHSQTWQRYVQTPRPEGSEIPLLHTGVYLSGNKVIADEGTAGSLRSVWQKAAAIDMEASGVASVLWHLERPPAFLVIKSICDYADSSKNDDWQDYCADAAASCAFSFVFEQLGPADIMVPKAVSHGNNNSISIRDRALRESFQLAYNIAELKVLSFDLGIDWEELPQGPKSTMIVELVKYARRHGMFDQLVDVVNRDRDGILNAYCDK